MLRFALSSPLISFRAFLAEDANRPCRSAPGRASRTAGDGDFSGRSVAFLGERLSNQLVLLAGCCNVVVRYDRRWSTGSSGTNRARALAPMTNRDHRAKRKHLHFGRAVPLKCRQITRSLLRIHSSLLVNKVTDVRKSKQTIVHPVIP